MKNTRLTSATNVVVVHDSSIVGPATIDDALQALARIAAEVMLDLTISEVSPVAA